MSQRRSAIRRALRTWKRFAIRTMEWCDGCLMLTGMLSWAISRVIPVEISWCSAAIMSPRFA